MAKTIRLTKRASKKLHFIASYIEQEFEFSSAESFSRKVANFFNILSEYPQIGKCIDDERKIYGFVLTKHTTLYYRITNETVIILNLFDNRTNPDQYKF